MECEILAAMYLSSPTLKINWSQIGNLKQHFHTILFQLSYTIAKAFSIHQSLDLAFEVVSR